MSRCTHIALTQARYKYQFHVDVRHLQDMVKGGQGESNVVPRLQELSHKTAILSGISPFYGHAEHACAN